MTGWPEMVNQAVTALRLDANRLRRLGGASGATWDTGQWVLRVGQPAALDTELMAATAAAGVVPVPRVIERADFGAGSAVLLERLPGRPAADLADDVPRPGRDSAGGTGLGVPVHAPRSLPALLPRRTGACPGGFGPHLSPCGPAGG